MLSRFLRDQKGATAIEYGLIAVLIGLAIVSGATELGKQLSAAFPDITEELCGVDNKGECDAVLALALDLDFCMVAAVNLDGSIVLDCPDDDAPKD